MKRFLSISFCLSLLQIIHSQNFDYSPSAYDFDPLALTQPAMDTTGFNTCLHWNRIYHEIYVNNSGVFQTRLAHSLRQINNEGSIESNNKLSIPLYQFQEIINFKLRVIKDGKVVSESNKDDFKIVEEDGVKYRILAIDNVSIGCYVETILSYTENVEYKGTEYLQYRIPVKESMICLVTPEKVHFKVKPYNTELNAQDTVVNGRRFLISLMRDVKANKPEQYYMSNSHSYRIEYSMDHVDDADYHRKKWTDIGTSYYDNNFATFDNAKSGLKKFIKELKLDKCESTSEKVFVIEDYIKRNIAEVNNQATPDNITEILKSKYGSGFAINKLYMQTFREAGINFEIIGTCERSDRKFDKTFESDEFFTRVLFFFPETNAYLDPNAFTSRSPIISDEFLGQDGMRIKTMEVGGELRPVTTIKNIPVNDAAQSTVAEKYTITFASDLTSTNTDYYKSYSGFAEYGLRGAAYYLQPEERTKTFTELLKQNQTNSKVENLELLNSNLGSYAEIRKPFEIKAKISGPDLLEYAGDKVIFKLGEVIGTQSELYNEEKRQHDIETEFNHMYERDIVVVKPEGYEISGLESIIMDFECKSSDGKTLAQFHSNYKVDGDKIIIHIIERYDAIFMPLELYDQFSSVINAAADFNKITLLLKKKG